MDFKKLFIVLLVTGSLIGAVYGAAATLGPLGGVQSLGSANTAVTNDGDITVTKVTWNTVGSIVDNVDIDFANAAATTDKTCTVALALGTTTGGSDLAAPTAISTGTIQSQTGTGVGTVNISITGAVDPADVKGTTVTLSGCA